MFFLNVVDFYAAPAKTVQPGDVVVAGGWPGAWTYTWTHADAAAYAWPDAVADARLNPEIAHRTKRDPSRREALARV